jgi:hypothetical protein
MKRLKCLLNAEKFYVLVLEELQFHSCGGTHCETMIINFCVVPFCCSCGRIFEFVEEQRLSYAYSSPHTHTHTHTHRLGFNISVCTDSAGTLIVSCHVSLFLFLLRKYFLLNFFSISLSLRFPRSHLCE